MTDRYGPQTVGIEALLERVCNLTDEEVQALRDAGLDATWGAAWGAAWRAASDAGRKTTLNAAQYIVLDAALDAARALVVRDLIGQHGFTQAHYDTLVGPWESLMGSEWTRLNGDDR